MARITVEDCLVRENNRFSLVLLAAKRAKQLLTGANCVAEDQRGNKSVVSALREIAEGKVRYMTAEESEASRKAEQEAAAREREAGATIFTAPPVVAISAAVAAGDDDDDDDDDGIFKTKTNGNGARGA